MGELCSSKGNIICYAMSIWNAMKSCTLFFPFNFMEISTIWLYSWLELTESVSQSIHCVSFSLSSSLSPRSRLQKSKCNYFWYMFCVVSEIRGQAFTVLREKNVFKATFDNKVYGVCVESIIGVLHGSRVITIQESICIQNKKKRNETKAIRNKR